MTLMDESGEGTLVRAQAEAAAWIALLHSSERSPEIEAGLKRWIATDPLHAAAWEVATDIWNETSNLPRRIPPSPQALPYRPRRPPYFRPVLAIALVLFLACGGYAARYFMHPRVNTVVGEQRTLNLEDGTRVELNTDSHLVVKYDRQFRTVVLDSGEAYFQVAHESRPFVVVAGERRVLALGTAFTVRRDDNADNPLTVTLIEERVAMEPIEISDAQVLPKVEILGPGERLRVHRHAPATLDSPPMEKVTGWMRGQLIFDHTPLTEAVAEFNRYSAMKIAVASSQAGAIPVGGIFRISDSKSFARAVAETYNLQMTLHGSEIVLDEAPPQTALEP